MEQLLPRFPIDQIVLPPVQENDLDDLGPKAHKLALTKASKHSLLKKNNEWKQAIQAYRASIAFADAQVGRILNALENSDYANNTIIVFWSDHGYFLGEKGLWYKRKAFERSVRVPLIISVPGMSKGERFSKPVELLDLYPTLMDLCGISTPSTLSGKSLRPILESPQKNKWKKL